MFFSSCATIPGSFLSDRNALPAQLKSAETNDSKTDDGYARFQGNPPKFLNQPGSLQPGLNALPVFSRHHNTRPATGRCNRILFMMRLTRNTIAMAWTGPLHTGTASFQVFTHRNLTNQSCSALSQQNNNSTLQHISQISAATENRFVRTGFVKNHDRQQPEKKPVPDLCTSKKHQKTPKKTPRQVKKIHKRPLFMRKTGQSVDKRCSHTKKDIRPESHNALFLKRKPISVKTLFFCYNSPVHCCENKKQFLLFSKALCPLNTLWTKKHARYGKFATKAASFGLLQGHIQPIFQKLLYYLPNCMSLMGFSRMQAFRIFARTGHPVSKRTLEE